MARQTLSTKIKNLFRRSMSSKPQSKAVTTLTLTHNKASRASRSGPAAYARAARRYNFDSPVFVGVSGQVFKRHIADKDAHRRAHRGHRPKAVPSQGQDTVPGVHLDLTSTVLKLILRFSWRPSLRSPRARRPERPRICRQRHHRHPWGDSQTRF